MMITIALRIKHEGPLQSNGLAGVYYLLICLGSSDSSHRTEMFDWGGQPNARTMFPKVPSSSSKARGHSKSQEKHVVELEPERDWLGPRG